MVGIGLQCLHNSFNGGECLFAHHSVLLSGPAQHLRALMNGVSLQLITIIGRPLRASCEGTTQTVQRQQAFNDADDVRGRRGFRAEIRGPLALWLAARQRLLLAPW